MGPQSGFHDTLVPAAPMHSPTNHGMALGDSTLPSNETEPSSLIYVPLFGLKYAQQFMYSSGFDSSHRVRLNFDDPRGCLPKGVNIFSSDPCLDGHAYRRCLSGFLTAELSCSPPLLLELLEEKAANEDSESSEEDISDAAFIRRHVIMEALERIHEHSAAHSLSSRVHAPVSCLATHMDDTWLNASVFSAIEDALSLSSEELSQDRTTYYYEHSTSASAFLLSGKFVRLLSPQIETRFCHFDFVLPDPSTRRVMVTIYPEPEYFARYASDIYVIADDISEHKAYGALSRVQREEHAKEGAEQYGSKRSRNYTQDMEACDTVRNYASHRLLTSTMFTYVHSAYEHWLDVIEKLFMGPWSKSASFLRLCSQFIECKVFGSLSQEHFATPEDVYLAQSLTCGIRGIVCDVFNSFGGNVTALPELPANELLGQINEAISASKSMHDILSAVDVFTAKDAQGKESSFVESFHVDTAKPTSVYELAEKGVYNLKDAQPGFLDLESLPEQDQVGGLEKDIPNKQVFSAPTTPRILEAVAQRCMNEFSDLFCHPPLTTGPGMKLTGFESNFPHAIRALIELKGGSHAFYTLTSMEEKLRYLMPLVLDRLYTYQHFTTATFFYDSLLEHMRACTQETLLQTHDHVCLDILSAHAYYKAICQMILRFNNILLRTSQAQHNGLLLDGMEARSVSFVASCTWPEGCVHGTPSTVSLTIRPLCPCYFCNMVAMDETDLCVDRAYSTCKACLCKSGGSSIKAQSTTDMQAGKMDTKQASAGATLSINYRDLCASFLGEETPNRRDNLVAEASILRLIGLAKQSMGSDVTPLLSTDHIEEALLSKENDSEHNLQFLKLSLDGNVEGKIRSLDGYLPRRLSMKHALLIYLTLLPDCSVRAFVCSFLQTCLRERIATIFSQSMDLISIPPSKHQVRRNPKLSVAELSSDSEDNHSSALSSSGMDSGQGWTQRGWTAAPHRHTRGNNPRDGLDELNLGQTEIIEYIPSCIHRVQSLTSNRDFDFVAQQNTYQHTRHLRRVQAGLQRLRDRLLEHEPLVANVHASTRKWRRRGRASGRVMLAEDVLALEGFSNDPLRTMAIQSAEALEAIRAEPTLAPGPSRVTPMMWASHLYGPKVLWEAYHQINYGNHTDVPPVTLERGLWAPSRARLLPAHGERRYRTLGSVEGLALAGHTITVSGLGSGEADLAEGPVQVRSQLPDPTHTRLAFDDVLAALLGLQEGGEMERCNSSNIVPIICE
ncbi:Hypothetical protein DHA2_154477 [Giardia duodenalis]|uniref:Uncharacterized protein n=1 Tax=Giardia intestinalis TaxID=5741 RepID=V6TK12_GIAIN|nr:Hypothetical protein DHA2_154477 [Giardia intestinalis]